MPRDRQSRQQQAFEDLLDPDYLDDDLLSPARGGRKQATKGQKAKEGRTRVPGFRMRAVEELVDEKKQQTVDAGKHLAR